MTKFYRFLIIIPLILWGVSCSDDDKNGPDPGPDPDKTSLTISSSKTEITLGGDESFFTFTVTDANNEDKTSEVTFYANGEEIDNPFYPTEAGTYKVSAKLGETTSNEISLTVHEDTAEVTMVLTANSDEVNLDNVESIEFNVTLDKKDITKDVSFYANEKRIQNPFSPDKIGEYTIYAKLDEEKSNDMKVTVRYGAGQYAHKVLLETGTATWCQYCPRGLWSLLELEKDPANANVLSAALHSGDKFEVPLGSQLLSHIGIPGFPTTLLNRDLDWSGQGYDLSTPRTYLRDNSPFGIAISSDVTNTEANVEVSFRFNEDAQTATGLRYYVYIIEDNLKATQNNYYGANEYFGVAGNLIDFNHTDVIRGIATGYRGNSIEKIDIESGEFAAKLSVKCSLEKIEDVRVMAFIVNKKNKVLNAQEVKANASIDFETAK